MSQIAGVLVGGGLALATQWSLEFSRVMRERRGRRDRHSAAYRLFQDDLWNARSAVRSCLESGHWWPENVSVVRLASADDVAAVLSTVGPQLSRRLLGAARRFRQLEAERLQATKNEVDLALSPLQTASALATIYDLDAARRELAVRVEGKYHDSIQPSVANPDLEAAARATADGTGFLRQDDAGQVRYVPYETGGTFELRET